MKVEIVIFFFNMSYGQFIKEKACELNNNKTEAEIEFEKALKITLLPYKTNKPIKTKYQRIIRGCPRRYIVDFLILNSIVVEVDGGYHTTPEQQIKDIERDAWLKSYGFKVYRIKNEDVMDGRSLDFLRQICRENKVWYDKKKGKYNYSYLLMQRKAQYQKYKTMFKPIKNETLQ